MEAYEVAADGWVLWNLQVAGAGVGTTVVLYRASPVGSLVGEATPGGS